jgi:hypothetical protein
VFSGANKEIAMSMPHNRPCIHPEPRNPAVHRCCQARNRVLADCKGLNIEGYNATILCIEGYLAALPELSTTQDIKDYTACIQHAVAINVIDACDAPALLATARVALNAIRADDKAREAEARLRQADDKIEFERARHERLMAKMQHHESRQPAA